MWNLHNSATSALNHSRKLPWPCQNFLDGQHLKIPSTLENGESHLGQDQDCMVYAPKFPISTKDEIFSCASCSVLMDVVRQQINLTGQKSALAVFKKMGAVISWEFHKKSWNLLFPLKAWNHTGWLHGSPKILWPSSCMQKASAETFKLFWPGRWRRMVPLKD